MHCRKLPEFSQCGESGTLRPSLDGLLWCLGSEPIDEIIPDAAKGALKNQLLHLWQSFGVFLRHWASVSDMNIGGISG
jgi:hypothetical protein